MASSKPVSAAYSKRIQSYVNRYFPEYRGARLPAEVRRAANGNPSLTPKTSAGEKALALKAISDPKTWGEALQQSPGAQEKLAQIIDKQPNLFETAEKSALRYHRYGQIDVTENYSGTGPVSFSIGIGVGRENMTGPASTPRPMRGKDLAELMKYYAEVPVPVLFFQDEYGYWDVEVAINTP